MHKSKVFKTMIEHYSQNIQNVIQREIFNSNTSIKVVVAWFTNNLLFQPLLMKLMCGVTVDLILNKDDINLSTENEIDFNLFVQNGGQIHWNETSKLMHEKFCIIDDRVVISGSYNWTNKAEYNDESITLFRDEAATVQFYNDSFARLAEQYPISMDCCISKPSYRKEKCPIKQAPYTKLNFYNSVLIRHSHHHTYVFANESEGGLFALLDNQTFLPKTEYMFGEIPSYDAIYDKNEENTIWIKGETAWGLFDCKKLEYVVSPQFDSVVACREHYNCYFVLQNGKYGAYNSKGAKLLNCEYDELKDLSWSGIRTKKYDKYGLFYTWDNTSLIPCEYDSVKYLENNYSYILEKNGKFAITYKGVLVTAAIFEEYKCNYDYSSSIIVRMNGKYGLCYEDKQVLKCEYDELKINCPTKHNGKYGIVLGDGNIALDFIYDEIKSYKGRFYVIKNGKYALYNSENHRINNRWVDTEEAIRKEIDMENMLKEFASMRPLELKNFI